MRPLIITLALAVMAAAGYFVYTKMNPSAPSAELFAPAAPLPEAALAEDCPTAQAVYELADDRRVMLRFAPAAAPPRAGTLELRESEGHILGNMDFVVRVTTLDKTLRSRQMIGIRLSVRSGKARKPMCG